MPQLGRHIVYVKDPRVLDTRVVSSVRDWRKCEAAVEGCWRRPFPLQPSSLCWMDLQPTDLLLGDHGLVDKVLQLFIGKVDTQLLKAVHSQVLQRNTRRHIG
ncbi:hypothetical protein EYF80_039217 [Liparis tanakae]|uniref:Uncharacterized protein n=1 Tax=Liparis tanakae TaxID=230148 RepID=A0A4Z2GAG7_9TELE|nr:hypothetical protein EYF80_039217 [Liparis tanakae]